LIGLPILAEAASVGENDEHWKNSGRISQFLKMALFASLVYPGSI
jgi:hypothetical protein